MTIKTRRFLFQTYLDPFFVFRFVTKSLWFELAAWRRHLGPWKLQRTGCSLLGLRLLNPFINMALCIDRGKDGRA